MGQTALETILNELKHVLLLPFFFAGQIIFDTGAFVAFPYLSYISATRNRLFKSPFYYSLAMPS